MPRRAGVAQKAGIGMRTMRRNAEPGRRIKPKDMDGEPANQINVILNMHSFAWANIVATN
jgi:hypothetical protein